MYFFKQIVHYEVTSFYPFNYKIYKWEQLKVMKAADKHQIEFIFLIIVIITSISCVTLD
jgi:hypothetical protein